MKRTPHATILTLALILTTGALAGCLSADDGAGDAAPEPAATTHPDGAPSTNATADAGNATTDGATAPSATPVTTATALAYDGVAQTGACAHTPGFGTCHIVDAGENVVVDLETPGTPTRLRVNVTWDAATPLGEEMVATILVNTPDGYRWVWNSTTYAEGANPLALDWDLTQFATIAPHATGLALYVGNWNGEGAEGAGGGVEARQPFSVEGVVVSVAPS